MRYSIDAQLTYQFSHSCEVLLLLEAARSPDQSILSESLTLSPPCEIARLDDSITGERRAVFTGQGQVDIAYTAQVELLVRDCQLQGVPRTPLRELPSEALRYLRPSHYCPSNRFEAYVWRKFGQLQGGDKVAAIVDWVSSNLDYRAGVSDASTTALDTFADRAGVCRDFAHLAISFCRAADIPARAVSAYAWKLQPPDLHAVAEVYLGGRWRLVDPTGLAPIDGLVRVATGMDAADIAFMTIFGSAQLVYQSFAITQDPAAEMQP
jgi:transglutaminase-like putative cysteine protease